ncbi:olfactory receptor 8B3-like [Ursus americanus]|uniref:olfactory receptor 8B3-like n=1 Tax=Ursus americanus TaxID=9643 RepID=UPI001E67AC6B|nr:olfactory receptor 8B3-like [Ursus americanus]
MLSLSSLVRTPAPRSPVLLGTIPNLGLPDLMGPAEGHLGPEELRHPRLPNGAIYHTRHGAPDHQAHLEDSRFPKRRTLVRNDSLVTEFLLAGLTDRPELQQPLFILFLMIYIVTMVGNLGLILLIGLNSHLHTPMYYFLFNLSFIDLCYSSVFTPKMLMNFVSRENIISYVRCMTQLFFFLFFVISECYMLTSMAYDRYVAICNPLLYRVTMSHQVCSLLTVAAYMMGFAGASAHTGCMLRLTFCSVNIINHYLCDILPLLQLSCTSTYVNEVVVLIVVGINITVPSFTILISYVFILSSILHIKSAQGRSKAFSTCSSHIIALSLFFGSAAFMYLKYSSPESMDLGKISSVFYTNVVPMLNPLIYSLRNKDIKVTLQKALFKIWRRNML